MSEERRELSQEKRAGFADFIVNVWSVPAARADAVVSVPYEGYCLVAKDCPIFEVLEASQQSLRIDLRDSTDIEGYVPVQNCLINAIVTFMCEGVGVVTSYRLPDTNWRFVNPDEGKTEQ